jgi:hypothetical protein
MERIITLRECLDRMDAGLTFSVKFAQFDKKRPRNRGKWQEFSQVKTIVHADRENVEEVLNLPDIAGKNPIWQLLDKEKDQAKIDKRNAHHREHMTRNICVVLNGKTIGDPIKLHLDLMVRFDGIKVKLP